MEDNALELKLQVFEGPLELLLHLIEKNKIDIYDIPIFEITRQYLDYLKNWDDLNMEVASEFIVMASILIGIKARRLLPLAQKADEEEVDEEAALIQRLLEYKKYKDAAGRLKGLLVSEDALIMWRALEVIQGERPIPTPEELLKDKGLEQLFEMFQRAERSKKESFDVNRAHFRAVRKDVYTVADKIKSLRRSLELFEKVSFLELRKDSHSKQETIAYFMAMLELSRMSQVSLSQQSLFGDIIMEPRKEETPHAE